VGIALCESVSQCQTMRVSGQRPPPPQAPPDAGMPLHGCMHSYRRLKGTLLVQRPVYEWTNTEVGGG
jgi:hypothetical protein